MLTRIYRYVDDGSELCFYVDSQGKLSDRELRQLQWLIAETYQSGNTQMEPALTPGSFIEIGPRLNVETPFFFERSCHLPCNGYYQDQKDRALGSLYRHWIARQSNDIG